MYTMHCNIMSYFYPLYYILISCVHTIYYIIVSCITSILYSILPCHTCIHYIIMLRCKTSVLYVILYVLLYVAAARPTHTSQSTRSRHSIAVDGVQIQEEQSFIVEIKPRLVIIQIYAISNYILYAIYYILHYPDI